MNNTQYEEEADVIKSLTEAVASKLIKHHPNYRKFSEQETQASTILLQISLFDQIMSMELNYFDSRIYLLHMLIQDPIEA